MWFKLTYSIDSMHVRRQDQLPARVSTNETGDEIVLWMRVIAGHPAQLCCDALVHRELKPSIAAMFDSLAANKLPLSQPPQLTLPHEIGPGVLIDAEGNLPPKYGIPLRLFPAAMQDFIGGLSRDLAEQITSFVKLLRWVEGAAGRQSPFAHVSEQWSYDNETWRPMPSAMGVYVLETKGIDCSPDILQSVRKGWAAGAREPLAHELVREAMEISGTNPRSGLLIGMSALETGVKDYIHWLVPNSNLILEKVQSPSVLTLTQQVIPDIERSLNRTSSMFPLSKVDKEYMQKWIAQRNKVAHGTKSDVAPQRLAEFLRFARSCLYGIDLAKGQQWAARHMKGKAQLF